MTDYTKYNFNYGRDPQTNAPIIANRITMPWCGPNGIICGNPGSGKTLTARNEMLQVLENTDDYVIVLDPEDEYGPMAQALNGEIIEINHTSNHHINPFDLTFLHEDDDFKNSDFVEKIEFIIQLLSEANGTVKEHGLCPQEKSVVAACVRKIYEPYIKSVNENGVYNNSLLPTLLDLQKALNETLLDRHTGQTLAKLLDEPQYEMFKRPTNFENTNRFTIYQFGKLGEYFKPTAMLVALDHTWQVAMENSKQGIKTWIYVDECYYLMKPPKDEFIKHTYWKRARTSGVIFTFITEYIHRLFESEAYKMILSNAGFIMMLNLPTYDRNCFTDLFNLGEDQKYLSPDLNEYGLLYLSQSIIPFKHQPLNQLIEASYYNPSRY